jgi:beta-phosphoglucomutase family hydrolase
MELPNLQTPTGEQSLGHCFGCGELNPIGLQLRPSFDGERMSATFTPGVNHQGWNNVTHGGILYSILDEITAYMVLCSGYSFGVTAKSVIRFRRVAPTDCALLATAWATKVTPRLIEVRGTLAMPDGSVVAEVESAFIPGARCRKAFLWDLDGVIIDSGADHFESWRQALAAHGVEYSIEQFASFFGMRDDLIIRRVMGPTVPDAVVHSIAEEKERLYRQMVSGSARAFPGVLSLLSAMKRGGYRVALGTSAPMENVNAVLPQLGLSDAFDAIVCGQDAPEGKPSPEIYLKAAERVEAAPADCIVFEDSPHGLEAARRAGMKCVAVTNTHPAQQLAGADRVVGSMEEMDLVQLIRWI